ncbi:MAG TPA: CvpA family protein [Candidatus Sulfotelmatobacter sp.]|jgi:uncharacterized membrane protein required for colicin V production|nr:CvpA family protein [Candidatus Sulfotelmatobacter sp.]
MIAATVQKSSWWHNLSFNWFDIALLAILAFGFWRGRKRGMSREALPTSMWLVAIVGAGFGYHMLGEVLLNTGYVRKIFGSSVGERTTSYIICYVAICIFVLILNSILKKVFKEKVAGSNAFGSGEYYLGMIAGMIRYSCIIIFFLALLNAPVYSSAEIQADQNYRNRWYGGGLKDYSGDFIPTIPEVQTSVFKKSLVGPFIHDGLGCLLIGDTTQRNHASDGLHR